jgi:hypothetical protein
METFLTKTATKTIPITHQGFEGTFTIGPIDNMLRAHVDDSFETDAAGAFKRKHSRLIMLFQYGVRGWADIKDAAGQLIEFKCIEEDIPYLGKRTKVANEALNEIDFYTIIEVAIAIIRENYVSASEKKE